MSAPACVKFSNATDAKHAAKRDYYKTFLGPSLLILVSLLWGTSFPLIKVIVSELGTTQYVALRFGLSTSLLFPYFLYALWGRRGSLTSLKPGALLGVIYFGGIWLQGLGMEYTSASNAGFITSLYIPIVYAIDLFYRKLRYTREFLLAMLLSVVGMYLVTGGSYESRLGDVIVLGGAVFWAFHVLAVDKFSKLHSTLDLVFAQYAVTAALALLFSSVINLQKIGGMLLPLSYLAVVCSLFVGFLQLVGQRHTEASQAALIYAAEPMFAALFSYLMLGEQMETRGIVGAVLIVASVLLSLQAMSKGRKGKNA